MVREFHLAMGLPTQPAPLVGDMLALRIKLIAEELRELHDAETARDVVETCDAICDLAYVLLGTFDCVDRVARPRFELLIATTNLRGWTNFGSTFRRETDNLVYWVTILLETMGQGGAFHRWDLLDTVMVQLGHVCSATGIDMRPLFEAVHRNNLTKAGGPVVNGKLCKPPGFVPVDLKPLLEAQGVRV